MAEQRKAPRQKSFLRGLVYFDGATSPIECVVRDISGTGARLKLPSEVRRTGPVDLYIPISGKKYKGVVRRQYGDEIGIAFNADAAPDSASAPKRGASGAESSKARNAALPVLIVDDSATTARVIGAFLTNLGFTDVDAAHDGHGAIENLKKKQYGLILSDWEMAPMSGEEFLKRKRLDRRNANTPVVIVSAAAGRGSSWLAGASAHLAKPFSERDLEAAIDRALYLNSQPHQRSGAAR